MAKQILVVGVNKAGKSSVIKGLAEVIDHSNETTNDPNAVQIEEEIMEHNNVKYRFMKAPSLAEVVGSKKDEDHKLAHLEQLKIFASQHIDLILFVNRNGTIHNYMTDMYTLVTHVMPRAIPIIGVITGCENELDMQGWATSNRHHFERNGLVFDEILGTCFGRGGRMESIFVELRRESASALWRTINSLAQSDRFEPRRNAIIQVPKKDNRRASSVDVSSYPATSPNRKKDSICNSLFAFVPKFRS